MIYYQCFEREKHTSTNQCVKAKRSGELKQQPG